MDLDAIDGAIDKLLAHADDRDRAFARAIYDAAIRRWITLRFLVERHLSRGWDQTDPKLRGALLAASAQLLVLNRVPESAAINHAVEWVKVQVGPGPAKAANAVLRRILDDLRGGARHDPAHHRETFAFMRDELPLGGRSTGSMPLSSQLLPEDEAERVAVATSHPTSLIRAWLTTRPLTEVRRLCLHSLVDPPIVLNVDHATEPIDHPGLSPHDDPGNMVFEGAAADLRALLTSRSDIWVQDSASCRAVRSIRNLTPAPNLIIDACAGMGTKTRQLAATFPNAEIVAADADPARSSTLASVFARSDRVRVVPFDRLVADWHGRADLVLLDVPCSNTGVLPRRPEARFRFDDQRNRSLTGIQRQIIADAIPLLREHPRGSILYSTCSLEHAENQAQAQWAVQWHRFAATRENRTEPGGLPGDPPSAYRDGAYSLLLQG